MQRPLLSIVVPSCNRHQYLVPVLNTLLSETHAELIVSDNSTTPLPQDLLGPLLANGRLVYQHHIGQLSVVENFERALRMATGEYLIFIGDDDCVGPGIENIVRWAQQEKIDALVSYRDRFIANYFWPGVTSKYFGDGYAGKLFLAKHTGKAHRLDTKAAIRDAARRPGTGLGSMARAYHGIVSRELIERVIEKYGQVFGGVSPDIYSATLLTHEAQRAYVLDYPFVIPGASSQSTAGEGAARKDVDKLKERDHIRRFGEGLKWDDRIPAFYSPVTVWAYSHQQALDRLEDPSFSLDFPRLYLRCVLQYWSHRSSVHAAIRHWRKSGQGQHWMSKVVRALGAEFMAQAQRIWYRFVTPPNQSGGLQTIGDAYALIQQQLGHWVSPGSTAARP